jgi:sec-independent protein translocase protein TatC
VAKAEKEAEGQGSAPDASDNSQMPLLEHLIELRNRLAISVIAILLTFIVFFIYAEEIYGFLVEPLAVILAEKGHHRMIYTGLTEVFFTYIKVAFFTALFVSFPVIATQIWMFVAPGLYRNEKGAFLPFLVATPVLFLLGAALVYYLIFPLAWRFFLSFEAPGGAGGLPIQLEAKVNEYLSLVMTLIFAFGMSFQLPVLLTLMARVGLVSSAALAAKRKYAVVIAFITAAVLTPPDIISQVALALPIMVLYEISIIAVRMIEKKAALREAEEDDDETAP